MGWDSIMKLFNCPTEMMDAYVERYRDAPKFLHGLVKNYGLLGIMYSGTQAIGGKSFDVYSEVWNNNMPAGDYSANPLLIDDFLTPGYATGKERYVGTFSSTTTGESSRSRKRNSEDSWLPLQRELTNQGSGSRDAERSCPQTLQAGNAHCKAAAESAIPIKVSDHLEENSFSFQVANEMDDETFLEFAMTFL